MNEMEIKLRRLQEQASATTARKALDLGNAAEALSIVEEATEFWPQNLIIFMSVIGFYDNQKVLVKRAYHLFRNQLAFCSNVNSLSQLVLWIRNPSRAKSIPNQLKEAIDRKRKEMQPDWDGIWVDGGTGPNNRSLAMKEKLPDEVHNTDDCLIMASQASNWGPWINRYCFLGGSTENKAYLKLMVAKAVSLSKSPTPRIKGLLRKFTKIGDISEVRRFLKNITPTHRSLKGIELNPELARYALYLYAECERLEHTAKDWVHIARSALYLNQRVLMRITHRILAEVERNADVDEVLEQLVIRNGQMMVTDSVRNDVGIQGNSIWESLYHRIPVNADARKILSVYSRKRMGLR